MAALLLSPRAGVLVPGVKSLPAVWETQVHSLGWEYPLEKEMAAHSSILAWRTPWMQLDYLPTEPPGKSHIIV